MIAHTIQDRGIPAALSFDEVFGSTSQCTYRLETPPHNQQSAAADLNSMPATPASPCPNGAPSASARFVTGKLSDIEAKYSFDLDPQVLGTGGHAAVRRCVNRATGRRYAAKSICKSHPAVKLDDLTREVALLQEMNHRSIIRLVDVFEDVGHLHLVTDVCEGGELFDRIVKRSSEDNGTACFKEDEAAGIICQILMSVSYMHKLGIVHRDIKPQNILFETADEDSLIKIIDFGLSKKHLEGLEPPMTTTVGTPYYIAPEVLRKKYDKSCDLWSVGVIAYTLLCGYLPFNGNGMEKIHRTVLMGMYYFPAEDWKGVSFEAQDFVRQLLQMDPRRRMTVEQALDHPWMARHSDRLVEVEQRDDTHKDHAGVFFNSQEGHAGVLISTISNLRSKIAKRRARKAMLWTQSRVV